MSSTRRLCLGLAYLLVVVAVAAFAVAMNRGVFEHDTRIEVLGDRAGLTLAPGARVKFRGVDVGKVSSIEPVHSGARIDVDLFDNQVRFVPADVVAQIIPPTAFGAKYVNLVADATAGGPPIVAGARVRAEHVTTEFNDAFENLTKLMQVAQPERVNNALTASARILDGRGAQIGQLVTGLEQYLGSFNTSLPELSQDVQATGPVLRVYDRSADDLVTVLDNLGVASRTLTARQSSLGDLLTGAAQFSTRTGQFLDTNQPGIARVVNLYDPVTSVLGRYSPELPCTLGGAVVLNGQVENIFGGKKPGYYTYSKFRPSVPAYSPESNLPVVRDDSGPHCFGLPVVDQSEATRRLPTFDAGANPGQGSKPPADQLAGTFFGALQGLVSGP
jgi:virulence factor Mce-like protein